MFSVDPPASDVSSASDAPIAGVEVRAEAVCVCVIDDCLDADVPLVEVTLHGNKNNALYLVYVWILCTELNLEV